MASPLRFQLAVATVAIGGAVTLSESQGTQAPAPDPAAVLTFQDRAIDESSGLVDAGSTVLTVNDSGDDPVVYVVDRASGSTVGRTTYTDEVTDVEAMAPGQHGTLWVGDIGDNRWSRSSVAVYELPMPTPGDRTVDGTRYDLVYEGGPRDAETLLVNPVDGRLYVVSKGLFGGQVFEAPARMRRDRPNVLRPVADVGGLITDGAFLEDGRFALIRSYSNLTVLAVPGWRNVQGMRLPDQDQGEGLAVEASGRAVLASSEGTRTKVLEVPLSRGILARIAEPPARAASERGDPTAPEGDDRRLVELLAGGAVTIVVLGAAVLWWRRRRA